MHAPIVTESEERSHLQNVRAKIKAEIDQASSLVDDRFRNLLELKNHLSEHTADMDRVVKAAAAHLVHDALRERR